MLGRPSSPSRGRVGVCLDKKKSLRPRFPPHVFIAMVHQFRSSEKQTPRQEACKGYGGKPLVRNNQGEEEQRRQETL